MENKGKILFLAYHFPPSSSTVAGVRSGNLALELAKNGWQVTVITPASSILTKVDPVGQPLPQHENLQIIGTPHDWPELAHWWVKERPGPLPKILGKLGRGFFQLLNLDQSVGWCRHVRAAAAAFGPGAFDLLLATGSPYISFKLAAQLARRLQCPYILDYRDLWTADPHTKIWNPLIIQREKKLLRGAAAAVVVAGGMASSLHEIAPQLPLTTITNGFAPELFSQVEPAVFPEPAFVYTGRFMPPLRTVEPIFQALQLLAALAPSKLWKFHYYGQNGAEVTAAAANFGLSERLVCHGVTSRAECLAAIKGARGTFVITSNSQKADVAERGILTGKLFEPIGLGSPVICITPEESEARQVVTTTASGAAFWSGESEAIANYLAQLLQMRPAAGHGEEYSWPILGKKYSDLLSEAIK